MAIAVWKKKNKHNNNRKNTEIFLFAVLCLDMNTIRLDIENCWGNRQKCIDILNYQEISCMKSRVIDSYKPWPKSELQQIMPLF